MSHNLSNKISLAINTQLPEFVREDYPLFIRFIESYYEFLENKLNNDPSYKNDLYSRAQQLKSIADVDESLSDFEENFFNIFLEFFPKDTQASKELLIKNSIPFYKSKGNERAFKYFFRSLFDEEIDLFVPKNDVLVVSGSVWKILRTIRVTRDVYSTHTVSGDETITFNLALPKLNYPQDPVDEQLYITGSEIFQWSDSTQKWNYTTETLEQIINVYVNDVLQTHITDYTLIREENRIIFNTALTAGDILKIHYLNFDPTLLVNRELIGGDSGATAILENSISYIKSGIPIFEYEIDAKTIRGNFISGEAISTNIIVNDELLSIILEPFSALTSIKINDGGSSYNVGDPVLLYGGNFITEANASVSSVFDGNYNLLTLNYGGAGFKTGYPINVSNVSPYSLNGAISLVDTTGKNTASSYVYNTDLIYDISALQISSANYKSNNVFIPNETISSPNVNTKLCDVFNYSTLSSIGDITEVVLISSDVPIEQIPIIDAESANIATYSYNDVFSDTFVLRTAGSLGRVDVINAGAGYQVGDKISFASHPNGYGVGARAAVKQVDLNGGIVKVELQPHPPANIQVTVTGSANLTPDLITVQGIDTNFVDELNEGDKIDLTINWTLSKVQYQQSFNLNSIATETRGLYLKDDGSRVYFLSNGEDAVYQADLLEEWNLDTVNTNSIVSVSLPSASLSGLYFNPTGTKMYFCQSTTGNNRIIEYSVGSAWNVLTATATTGANANVTTRETFVRGVEIANNGYSMYIVGTGSDVVNQYYLSTPYRVNTATWIRNYNPAEISDIRDIRFHPSGNSYYVMSSSSTGAVLQYSLSNQWNIATSTFVQSKDLLNLNLLNETAGTSLKFSTDGKYLFVLTNTNRYIFRYETDYLTGRIISVIDSSTSLNMNSAVTSSELIFPEGTSNTFITSNRNFYDVSIEIGNNYVIGTGSSFNTEFKRGDKIMVFNQEAIVNTVHSSRSLNVDSIWTQTKQNTEIGKFNFYPIGGQGYEQSTLPTVEVYSDTGVGAILSTTSIMGDGEIITAGATGRRGEILSIQVSEIGSGYKFAPFVDLTTSGDGTANAQAIIENSYFQYPGYYESIQGHLSNEKKIQDRIFYNTGTYLIKTKQQFKTFKTALLQLLNPAGTYPFVEFSTQNILLTPSENLINVSASSVEEAVNYELVLNGLTLHLDAANTESYSGSGTTWVNLADSYPGTLRNGPVFNDESVTNNYFIFDGYDDFVEVSHNENLSFGSDPFSIDLFFYVNNVVNDKQQRIIEKGLLNNTTMEYQLWINVNGRLVFSVSENGSVFSRNYFGTATILEPNSWYHVCFVREENEGSFYINGELKLSVSDVPSTLFTAEGALNIMGNYSLVDEFPSTVIDNLVMTRGNLATVKIYNRALSSDEVFNNYISIVERLG